jgi:hypothetical protein
MSPSDVKWRPFEGDFLLKKEESQARPVDVQTVIFVFLPKIITDYFARWCIVMMQNPLVQTKI